MEIFEQENKKTLFADILLPVPIPRLFTYRVPFNLNEHVLTGIRAIVQFGDRRIVTGIIMKIHEQPPRDYEAKYILDVLDRLPAVNDQQVKMFQWLSSYYACTAGEVLNAALPAGLKLSSESMVQLNPAFNPEESDLPFSEKEWSLLKKLQGETMTYSDIAKFLGVKHIHAILKSLAGKETIILFEEVRDRYKPKTERRIRLTKAFASAEQLEELFTTLESKPKQEEVLLRYLQHVPVLKDPVLNRDGMPKHALLAGEVSASSVSTLVKNGVLEEFDVVVPRFGDQPVEPPHTLLTEDQEKAQAEIFAGFRDHNVVLLHGMTGSGKTEIYISLIRKALDGGSQALYLLPEIALTTQIVQRLKKIFGPAMGVYHSKFSDNERVEVWNGLLSGSLRFVVGVRSSVFLPFDNLGLIIVDEEHDGSYKQQEPAPRYNARDVAIMLGQIHNGKVLLGSATPAVETYFNAKQGKFGLVTLQKRFGNAQLPSIDIADMRVERSRKTAKGEFSSRLLKAIEETIGKKDQVIIFQNRRGYSPMVTCEDCGWVPKCVNCAVSLTYHQYSHALVCHYCGYRQSLVSQCPVCTSKRIQTLGYGTEKLEEELNHFFPESRVQRMDLDTTRSKSGYETIIDEFERGETQILVGTQMVTKGLDFDRVSLVGVFNADRMIHFPDFRSHERAFQLITQVSGRAGRRDTPGKVVIQTSSPDHVILSHVLKNSYSEFYEAEISDRHAHGYPPFTRLIEITCKHTDKKICRTAAGHLAVALREKLSGIKVLGPGEPMVSKIRNQYLMSILIKIPRGTADLAQVKTVVTAEADALTAEKAYRTVRVVIDVDPF